MKFKIQKITFIILFLFICVNLFGCSKIHKLYGKRFSGYGVNELKIDDNINSNLITELKNSEKYDVKKCLNGTNADNCLLKRNIIIGDLMAISNSMCQNHIKSIWGTEASFNIFAGTFTNIFAGAASVVGSIDGKSILSGLALFSNSERSLVNESVYKNALVSAVVNKIVESRNNKSSSIATKLSDSSYEKYPINLAINDILDYHNSCSFMNGLLKALKEGSTDSRKAKIRELEHEANIIALKMNQKNLTADANASLNTRYNAINNKLTTLQTTFDGANPTTNLPEAKIEKLKSTIATIEEELEKLEKKKNSATSETDTTRKTELKARYKKLMEALTTLEISFDGVILDSNTSSKKKK